MFKQIEDISEEQSNKLYSLREYIHNLQNASIAYSGGVDSALVASIAFEQLGGSSIAITGVSSALANQLLQEARSQAKWIGIKHIEVDTSELENENYKKNPKNRCFACKQELHKHTTHISSKLNIKYVLDGVNLDDLGDYRPGIRAAEEAGVRSPLAILKFTKKDIRDISKGIGLPWWDKPAQPCLSSRFPYGYEISHKRLKMVEKAENYIREIGFKEVRVRSQGNSARIELPKNQIKNFINSSKNDEIIKVFAELGFKSTSIDLEGLISGKLNR